MTDDFESPDIEEFISGCVRRLCLECGLPLEPNANGRPRRFCSESCRRAFWRHHPELERRKSVTAQVCPACGRTFIAKCETKRKRKYCSHACANRSRRLKGEAHEDS